MNWLLLTPQENREAEQQALKKIERCITKDYVQLSQENHFKLIVALHPMLLELEQDYFPLKPLANILESNSAIKTINLFEKFKQAKKQAGFEYHSLYWQKDGHNNSRGYQLWADALQVEVKSALNAQD